MNALMTQYDEARAGAFDPHSGFGLNHSVVIWASSFVIAPNREGEPFQFHFR
jgi:hypothetical protein